MKLTKKTVKHEVEATETVCEITQAEFDKICAETAAATVVEQVGTDPEITDMLAGIAMTSLLAEFVANLDKKLFTNDTNTSPDKNEKEDK